MVQIPATPYILIDSRSHKKSTGTTTNAVRNVLDTYPLEDGATNRFEIVVKAHRAAATVTLMDEMMDEMSAVLRGSWARNGATVKMLGSVSSDKRGEASWSAVLVLNGTNVEVHVKGEEGETIRWEATPRRFAASGR